MAAPEPLRLAELKKIAVAALQIVRGRPWLVLFIAVAAEFVAHPPGAGLSDWLLREAAAALLSVAIALQLIEALAAQRRPSHERAALATVLGVAAISILFEAIPLAWMWSEQFSSIPNAVGLIARHSAILIVFSLLSALGWALFGPYALAQFRMGSGPSFARRFLLLLIVPAVLSFAGAGLWWLGEALVAASAGPSGHPGDLSRESVYRILAEAFLGLAGAANYVFTAAALAATISLSLGFVGCGGDAAPQGPPAPEGSPERRALSAVLWSLWPISAGLFSLRWLHVELNAAIASFAALEQPAYAPLALWAALLTAAALPVSLVARRRLGAPASLDGAPPFLLGAAVILGGAALAGAAFPHDATSFTLTAFEPLVRIVAAGATGLALFALIGPWALRFLAPAGPDGRRRGSARIVAPLNVILNVGALLVAGVLAAHSARLVAFASYAAVGDLAGANAGVAGVLLGLWDQAGRMIGLALYYLGFLYAIIALTRLEIEEARREDA